VARGCELVARRSKLVASRCKLAASRCKVVASRCKVVASRCKVVAREPPFGERLRESADGPSGRVATTDEFMESRSEFVRR
jgi:predicted RNA methylase